VRSVSGTAPGGNDPIGNRFVEALLAIEAVAKRCRCRRELVSVIHFDVPTAADLAPTPLRAHRGQIGRALQLPRNARGNSLLRPSLKEAHRIAEQLPSHRHVLCVLSDFQLFDDKLDELLDEFAAFPGDVHAVVLRADPPAQLVDDVRVTVTPIGYDDPPGALARAVFAAATTHRLPSRGGR